MVSSFLKWLFNTSALAPRRSARSTQSVNVASSPSQAIRLKGSGSFDFEVVGESYYLKNFERIFGPRQERGVEIEIPANLILEDSNPHDSEAVRVELKGLKIGHLPKNVAREFRAAAAAGGLAEHKVFEVDAIVRGGWDDGHGDSGHYGVRLDLKTKK